MTGAFIVSDPLVAKIELITRLKEHSRMGWIGLLICSLLFCISVITPANAQTSNEKGAGVSRLVGNWTGESVCANKEKFPGCNDEHVVYHVAVTPSKTDTVTIKMDKIVNGKPDFMGEGEFAYDAKKQTLVSEFKNARVHLVIEFAVKNDVIEGVVAALPERTVVRNIKVKKDR